MSTDPPGTAALADLNTRPPAQLLSRCAVDRVVAINKAHLSALAVYRPQTAEHHVLRLRVLFAAHLGGLPHAAISERGTKPMIDRQAQC